MKFLAFSAYLDRVALGMSLSARNALIEAEISPGLWLISSAEENAGAAYEYLFGMPPKPPAGRPQKGGASVILCAVSGYYGFAPPGFWERTGL